MSTSEDPVRACERLVARYAHTIDHGDFDAFAELFAADGRLVTPARTLEGRESIRDAMRERSPFLLSRHIITNIVIDLIDAKTARGLCYLVLFRDTRAVPGEISPSVGPAMIGEYRDEFVLTEEGWRFLARVLELSFRRAPEKS